MSTTSQPPVQGQIEAPNPIELFWEKNRRAVLFVIAAVAVAFAIGYGMEYMERQRQNAVWAQAITATELDKGYTEPGSFSTFLDPERQQFFQYYFSMTRTELLTQLGEDIGEADDAQLTAARKDLAGTDAEPLLLWVSAYRKVQARDWDAAIAALTELEQQFPSHFLCVKSEYPPQFRPEVEKDEDEDEAEPKANTKKEPPELEPALAGSPAANLRAFVEKQKAFEAEFTALYQAPEPDPAPTVIVRLSNDETFKIRFYRGLAQEHVDAFLANVRAGFYTNQAIDEVERKPAQQAQATWAEQLHLGIAASTEQDRSAWTTARAKDSSKQLEFEDNDLSHFPGMVAARKEGTKSSGERIWINANDCAQRFDGDRVIFGRVVEGLEVIETLCQEAPFVDESMTNNGRGQLQVDVRITAMEIQDDIAPPPAKEGEGEQTGGETGGGETGESGKSGGN